MTSALCRGRNRRQPLLVTWFPPALLLTVLRFDPLRLGRVFDYEYEYEQEYEQEQDTRQKLRSADRYDH
jgi:hypothetical protein